MSLTRRALLAALAAALPTHSAVAQTLTNGANAGGGTVLWAASGPASALRFATDAALLSSGETARPPTIGKVSWNILPLAGVDSAALAEEEQAGPGGVSSGEYWLRLFGGLVTSNGDGFTVGGGISAHPFADARHEIQGNASFLRLEGLNGFAIGANYLYNFRLSSGQFVPYAGGGLIFTHLGCGIDDEFEDLFGPIDCGVNDTNFQIVGGIRKPLRRGGAGSRRAEIGGQAEIGVDDDAFVILEFFYRWLWR